MKKVKKFAFLLASLLFFTTSIFAELRFSQHSISFVKTENGNVITYLNTAIVNDGEMRSMVVSGAEECKARLINEYSAVGATFDMTTNRCHLFSKI